MAFTYRPDFRSATLEAELEYLLELTRNSPEGYRLNDWNTGLIPPHVRRLADELCSRGLATIRRNPRGALYVMAVPDGVAV